MGHPAARLECATRPAVLGLYWAAYERISTSSRRCPRDYCRDAPIRKTIVQRDVEGRYCAYLFDICWLHIFYRDALTEYRVISHRAGVRLRHNCHDLRSDWKCDPQKEGQKVGRYPAQDAFQWRRGGWLTLSSF